MTENNGIVMPGGGAGGGPAKGGHRALVGPGGPGQGRNRGGRSGAKDTVIYPQAPRLAPDAVRVLCCVDDTDDLSGNTSTGFVAEQIAAAVVGFGGRVVLGITRHQLLLDERVPYTSHNSAMCLEALLPRGQVESFRQRAVQLVLCNMAPASDPGLCVYALPPGGDGGSCQVEAFGRRAQLEVCTKEEAYRLAQCTEGLTLSEHGGTGQGIIGALAGVGLRLGGVDGRFRGKWDLADLAVAHAAGETSGNLPPPIASSEAPAVSASGEAVIGAGALSATPSVLTAAQLCRRLKALVCGPVTVVDDAGIEVPPDAPVLLDHEAKPVLHRGCLAFVVEKRGDLFAPAQKIDLGAIGSGEQWSRTCSRFRPDADLEECAVAPQPTCRSCLFRRLTQRGFVCAAPPAASEFPVLATV